MRIRYFFYNMLAFSSLFSLFHFFSSFPIACCLTSSQFQSLSNSRLHLNLFFIFLSPLLLSFFLFPSFFHSLPVFVKSNMSDVWSAEATRGNQLSPFYYSCILFLPLHLSIHHIWPSNLAELLRSAPHKRTEARHTNINCLVFLFLGCQQPSVLSSFVHCVARSQSAESIAPLHLTVHSIRLNNGSMLD